MKIYALFLFLFPASILSAQSVFTYQPNRVTGNLEVFQTRQGAAPGIPQRIAEIYKNHVTGYMEIKEINGENKLKSVPEPFTNRPNYDLVTQIKPFDFPYQALIDQISALNQRIEYDIIQKQLLDKSLSESRQKAFIDFVKTSLEKNTVIANGLLNFYTSQYQFPSKLQDGYYYATQLDNQQWVDKAKNENTNGYFIKVGIARIEGNKIVEYFESAHSDMRSKESNIYRKLNLEVKGTVDKCKVSFRERGSDKYLTVYFFDNIIDPSFSIPNPNFGFFTVFTDGINGDLTPDKQIAGIKIVRNFTIDPDAGLNNIMYLPYSGAIEKSNFSFQNSCNNSSLTFAFKGNLGTYSFAVRILNFITKSEYKWTFNNMTIAPGTCTYKVLN